MEEPKARVSSEVRAFSCREATMQHASARPTPLMVTVEQMLASKAKNTPRRSPERCVLRALRRMRHE
jgi:hypothetical protein